jgi:hypothetical protein
VTVELDRVRAAAGEVADAREALDAAMLAASEAGASLRPIAEAAGLSVESARQRIANAKATGKR